MQIIRKKNLNKLAFVNAHIIDPCTKMDGIGTLLTQGKKIAQVGVGLSKNQIPNDATIIDCKKNILAPGIIDIRARLGEPGNEHKETITSASNAALSGGITSLVSMPDSDPIVDQISVVEFIARRARETNGVKIFPAASISKNLEGKKLTEMGLLLEAGVVLFTDANRSIGNSKMMHQALTYSDNFNILLMQHPEENNLSEGGAMNSGSLSTRLGLPGISRLSEIIQIERDIRLLENTGGKLHFSNISTKESVDIIVKAKKRGLNISCSTAPHYFLLNEEAVGQWRTFAKVSPPLRNEYDRKAIYKAIIKGDIDAIISDHSPHDQDSKRLPFELAASGIIGLETLLQLSLKLVHQGNMKLIDLLERLTYTPSKIIGLELGRLTKNTAADIIIFDPNQKEIIDPRKFKSKSRNCPFEKEPVKGKILATVVDGRIAFQNKSQKMIA